MKSPSSMLSNLLFFPLKTHKIPLIFLKKEILKKIVSAPQNEIQLRPFFG
jgi:hypothetical protein